MWSLPIGLDVVVFGTLLLLLQLVQRQLPPAPQRCFSHPEAVATDTHQTQVSTGATQAWLRSPALFKHSPQESQECTHLAALFTRLDTSL